MIYPTIKDLTKGKYNRYELSIATAKGARLITDEYVRQRAAAESAVGGNKENDKPVANMIDKKLKDEKAVKLSIDKLDSGEYIIVEEEELLAAQALEAEETEADEAAAAEETAGAEGADATEEAAEKEAASDEE